MKTRTCVLSSIFLVVLAMIFIVSSCENGGTTSILGTWVNSYYDGWSSSDELVSIPAKLVVTEADGKNYQVASYDNHDDTVPGLIALLPVTDEWTDSEGNLFISARFEDDDETIYFLIKIHADNQTFEWARTYDDYPTEIDPTDEEYCILYRQE